MDKKNLIIKLFKSLRGEKEQTKHFTSRDAKAIINLSYFLKHPFLNFNAPVT
jgi:hypothetical protein